MTDEQFKQLMDKLEMIQRAIDASRPYVTHPGSISGSPGCLHCGGYHGSLMCPLLSGRAGYQGAKT
jgi:hypothetical protein